MTYTPGEPRDPHEGRGPDEPHRPQDRAPDEPPPSPEPAPGQPAPGPYGVSPGGTPHYPQQPGFNVLAILTLIFAFLFAPAGIVLGHISRRQISRTGEQGEALANVGLVLSYVFTALAILACCAGIIAIAATGALTA